MQSHDKFLNIYIVFTLFKLEILVDFHLVEMSVKKAILKGFNVHIVEDHNEALEELYKEIGAKRLSFSNLTMLHFDSHPDLGIPCKLEADSTRVKATLFDSLSIENWILPAVYSGHINKIVWVKPNWSTQIKCGKYDLIIGKNALGTLSCNCKESYFLSDNLYVHEDNLVNQKDFSLYVCDFDELLSETKDQYLADLLDYCGDSKNLILDIDLDFFSTIDPFKLMFKLDTDYSLFKQVYTTKMQPMLDDQDFQFEYNRFLVDKNKKLRQIWDYLSNDDLDVQVTQSDLKFYFDLENLKNIIQTNKLDKEILHSYGAGLDEHSLPHHISSRQELTLMFEQMLKFFQIYLATNKPGVVTLARSSLDDYCPVDQVDFIQEEMLSCLRSYFGHDSLSSINLCYDF